MPTKFLFSGLPVCISYSLSSYNGPGDMTLHSTSSFTNRSLFMPLDQHWKDQVK